MRRARLRTSRTAAYSLPPADRWLLSYADFVTLLLAVFIVLLASSRHQSPPLRTVSKAIHSGFDALSISTSSLPSAPSGVSPSLSQDSRYASRPELPQLETTALKRELRGVLGDEIDNNEIVLQQTPNGLVISLRELGFFNSGEATLLPGASDKLRKAAAVLIEHGLEVRIEGHSDNQPIHTVAFESNWQLSTARAMSVLRLILDGTGFPPAEVSVAGYGPYHPIADNATAEGRRMNRRVDLVVVAPRNGEVTLR